MPLITDDLFGQHGITRFITDPQEWGFENNPVQPRDAKPGPRRLCLVEARRPDATAAFLKTIEDANILQPNGNRDWVFVYDWRVLEAITHHEEGDNSLFSGFSDPWRKYFKGLV
jgi:DNA ligase 4